MEGRYLLQGENALITGATGCGKSYLACALGYQACFHGHKTTYLGMNRFIEKVTLSKLDGSYIKLLNYLERQTLVILDDFGLQNLGRDVRLALLQLLEDRYSKKSIIITSQLPIAKWYEYINEPTLADAILDRLTANAHRIELKGESLRRKKVKDYQ
jgi:DNA replication protein DnaC